MRLKETTLTAIWISLSVIYARWQGGRPSSMVILRNCSEKGHGVLDLNAVCVNQTLTPLGSRISVNPRDMGDRDNTAQLVLQILRPHFLQFLSWAWQWAQLDCQSKKVWWIILFGQCHWVLFGPTTWLFAFGKISGTCSRPQIWNGVWNADITLP